MGGDIVQINASELQHHGASPDLADVVLRLASVMAGIAARIARNGIVEDLAGAMGTNSDGDAQKALDVIAD
ncbi:MAG: fructose-bisphosphatase class I, partial [Paracoccaceae bacterium]|nr:fructose-bisphosphatase class I [Paracoccaceae bacterium]